MTSCVALRRAFCQMFLFNMTGESPGILLVTNVVKLKNQLGWQQPISCLMKIHMYMGFRG